MTSFKEHVLEPGRPYGSLDADYGWFGKRCVKLADPIQIMKQIDRVRLASFRVTPGYRLLVWVKINSDV